MEFILLFHLWIFMIKVYCLFQMNLLKFSDLPLLLEIFFFILFRDLMISLFQIHELVKKLHLFQELEWHHDYFVVYCLQEYWKVRHFNKFMLFFSFEIFFVFSFQLMEFSIWLIILQEWVDFHLCLNSYQILHHTIQQVHHSFYWKWNQKYWVDYQNLYFNQLYWWQIFNF